MRQEFGVGVPVKTLPKGVRANCVHCPIARALGGPGFVSVEEEVVTMHINYDSDHPADWVIPLPDPVAEFIVDFDEGNYPDLVTSA